MAAVTHEERVLFEGKRAVLSSITDVLLTVLTLGLMAVVYWVRSIGRSYRITDQRVVIEYGVLSKRVEQLELARATDFVVELPFTQRLMSTGNLVVHAMDHTTPILRIDGIKTDVRALYEALRKAAEAERRKRGVRVVDYQ